MATKTTGKEAEAAATPAAEQPKATEAPMTTKEEYVGDDGDANNGANESTNEDGASSLPSHKDGFDWPLLLTHLQTNVNKYACLVHPKILDDEKDSSDFSRVCEAH